MRGVAGAVIAVWIALTTAIAGTNDTALPDILPPDNPMSDVIVDSVLTFRGIDVWRGGGSLHGGLIFSPDGVDAEGFAFKHLTHVGAYSYRAMGQRVRGYQLLDAILPGWRFKFDRAEVTAFAGLDVQYHWQLPYDPAAKLRGLHYGLRGSVDAWYEPATAWMTTASISVSSIGPSYWGRAAFGWRPFDLAWFGPEFTAMGDTAYRQYRIGIHATAFRTWVLEWTVGLGLAWDSTRVSGAYGRLGLLMRH